MRGFARCLVAASLLWATAATGAGLRFRDPVERREVQRSSAADEIDAGEVARRVLVRQLGVDWNEVLVTTADGMLETVLLRHGGSWRSHGSGRDVLRRPSVGDKFAWYASLRADQDVRAIQPNYDAVHPGCRQMSIDVLQTGGGLNLATQPALVGAQGQVLDANDVVVAIIDSGAASIAGVAERLLPGIDVLHPRHDDTPALPGSDPIDPLDPGAWDANGHGTAMASLVAALAENVRILPVRVVKGDCVGTVFDLAEGIRAAAAAGSQVISISLSVGHDSPVLRQAVEDAQAAGAIIVAAAGNSGLIEYPAALPGVVAVTAVDDGGLPPWFAPLGDRIDLAAPGVDVLAEGPTALLRMSGTSPSTAIVAASAAIVVGQLPSAGSEAWKLILLRSVTPVESIDSSLTGHIGSGVLDMSRLPRE